MKPNEITKMILNNLDGVVLKQTWGETSLFYNPGLKLPNGVYFCTIKESNGANDKSSDLDRDGVFRVSIGVPKESYIELFGDKPKRPAKGCIVDTGHDFTQLDILMPHPIYAWMSWVCINSPSVESYDSVYTLISQAHQFAISKFNKKPLNT